jgi:hypothetical protein
MDQSLGPFESEGHRFLLHDITVVCAGVVW